MRSKLLSEMNRLTQALVVLLVTACSTAQPLSPNAASTSPSFAQSGLKVAFFGSSTTVGVGASEPGRRWTTLVSNYQEWQEINDGLSGSTVADVPGQTVTPGVRRWRAVLDQHPDRVIVMYGANDVARNVPLPAFSTSFTALLSGLRTGLNANQILVLTPQSNYLPTARRGAYDQAMRDAANAQGVPFIEIGSKAVSSFDPPLNVPDGMHLNDDGHSALAAYVLRAMAEKGLIPPIPTVGAGAPLPTTSGPPLQGGLVRIDSVAPLQEGLVRAVEASWSASGRAVLGVARPSGHGFSVVYRTRMLKVATGSACVRLPGWRVEEGDRLFAWTDGPCLATIGTSGNTPGHVTFPLNDPRALRTISMPEASNSSDILALRAIQPEAGAGLAEPQQDPQDTGNTAPQSRP